MKDSNFSLLLVVLLVESCCFVYGQDNSGKNPSEALSGGLGLVGILLIILFCMCGTYLCLSFTCCHEYMCEPEENSSGCGGYRRSADEELKEKSTDGVTICVADLLQTSRQNKEMRDQNDRGPF